MANSERIYLIQGNDTDMSVCLRKGGDTPLPYDLTGASRIGLALTGHGLSFFARDIEVSGEDNNIISGLLAGDLLVGEYGLEVSFTLDGKAKRFRVPQVFEVVTYLSEDQDGTAEGEGDGISITVTVQPEVIEIAGPTGPQGHDGKSAYEVWIEDGHTGTEDDFFRWLAAQTPNPDWAQNDASEPDYVENRTHYTIPAVSLPDAFITFRWTEEDYSDLMFYLNDETPMPRMSENTWGVQLGQWLLSCYINGHVLEVDLDGDPILTVANFRPGRTPQPILVGDIEVPELVQQLDGKYLGLKTVNGQSVKGSGDIALNGGNLEYTGNDGEYISGGDSINSSLLLLDEAVDETNGRLDNLKGSQVVYDGEDGDSVIVHGDTVDQCLKGLDDQAAYIIDHYQYKISDLDTIRAGAALGATAYQKPSTGIPKSALASAVKTSLEKADTALQPSALNGYATEGYVDQEVYEQVSGKQDTLISGENIKTINGQSVLGSGDIQTGGGSADAVKYTEQELTDSQKEQARENIGATAPEIFFATYGETTAAEVDEAVAAGKVVVCQYGQSVYYLVNYKVTDANILFSSAYFTSGRYLNLNRSNDSWGYNNRTLQSVGDKVSSIVGKETSTVYYPNTKAVADAIGKWGVVSQKLTWTDTTGQKSTYTISNIVHGIIPQANIDLFVSLGAAFNETTGYFELGDSTDIAYDEMMLIYRARQAVYCEDCYYGTKLREILPSKGTTGAINNAFQSASRLRIIPDAPDATSIGSYPYITSYDTNTFRDCFSLRRIEIRLYGTSNSLTSATLFQNCVSLEYLRIIVLKKNLNISASPLLELSAVVYMVNTANNTTAITITLHADAYARCVADTTEYTYSGQTYTGIIAFAAAKNITIASA